MRSLAHDVSLSFVPSAPHKSIAASSERYNAIRKFFRQQQTSFNIAHRTGGQSFSKTRSVNYQNVPSSHFTRSFHVSALVHKQKTPGTSPNGPRPELPAQPKEGKIESPLEPAVPSRFDHYPHFLRRLALSVPNIHRPTRDDMLNAASGFWQRTRIRFRWFTIKSFRRFNADDISAFVTWFLMSQTLWIFVGT